MPLLVEGRRVRLPQSAGDLVRAHPFLEEDDIHLVTLCVTELNDREENENHFPVIYGIAVNIKTSEIYRASFQDRGPEEELRAARDLTGGPMFSIYDAKTEQLRIGPYSWMPYPHVDFWLQQDDKQILENLSTSPLAEPPHFPQWEHGTMSHRYQPPKVPCGYSQKSFL
eukprot:bmy_17677T0